MPTWARSARRSKPNWAVDLSAGHGRSMTGRIPDSFLDELVSRSDIVEIISARVPLKKAGREYKACCPFHNEKSPSFSVSADKQFYHCFGCGAHGTVIGFLMQYEKMEFLDAVADLAQRAGLEMPREAKARAIPAAPTCTNSCCAAARFFEQNLADNARAQAYVRAPRHRRARPRAKFALGYAPDSWDALLKRFGTQEEERRQAAAGGPDPRTRSGGERQRFLRSVPRSADVPDPRFARPRHRVRRARDRSRRAEVHELAGNAAVSQGPRTLWAVRGAPGARAISSDC